MPLNYYDIEHWVLYGTLRITQDPFEGLPTIPSPTSSDIDAARWNHLDRLHKYHLENSEPHWL